MKTGCSLPGNCNKGYILERAVWELMIIIVTIIIISWNGRGSMKYFLIIYKPVLLESK
jgi:hypothetical protein